MKIHNGHLCAGNVSGKGGTCIGKMLLLDYSRASAVIKNHNFVCNR